MAKVKDRITAFAFDIDGVILRGKVPIPGARETIKWLQTLRVPFIFLTNGGGHTEEAHVALLGQRLGLTLSAKQLVQSHTPFLHLVPDYADQTVLVLGGHGHQIRKLAEAYGFKNVITSSDIATECGHIHPFPEITGPYHKAHANRNAALRSTRISAIFVMSSPRDWCLDLQIVIDLLLSAGGLIGTRSPKNGDRSLPNDGYQQDGQPKLFFCNPDIEWSTSYVHPRLAQGAFRESLQGLWRSRTGDRAKLEYTIVGKPTEITYVYAEEVLREYGEMLDPSCEIGTVVMVGDNPESDIVGANTFKSRHGIEWRSVLVETGVHISGSKPTHKPHHTAKDVKEAVEWALQKDSNGERPEIRNGI